MTLSNYDALLKVALETGFIGQKDIATLQKWSEDPQNWAPYSDKSIE